MDGIDDIPMPPSPAFEKSLGEMSSMLNGGVGSQQQPGNGSSGASEPSLAWRKAQEALQKVQNHPVPGPDVSPSQASASVNQSPYGSRSIGPYPTSNLQMSMYQAYPWMYQYGLSFNAPSWMGQQQQQQQGFQNANSVQHPWMPTASSVPRASGYNLSQQQQQRASFFNSHQSENAASLPSNESSSSLLGNNTADETASGSFPFKLRPVGRGRPGFGYNNSNSPSARGGPRQMTPRFNFGQQQQQRVAGGKFRPPVGAASRGGGDFGPLGSSGYSSSSLGSSNNSPLAMAANNRFKALSGGGGIQQQSQDAMPPNMTEYVKRAYLAVDNEDDKNKVEKALKQKLMPLLHSGAAWTVDWDSEPLPTCDSFTLSENSWVPASVLKERAKETNEKRSKLQGGRNVFSNTRPFGVGRRGAGRRQRSSYISRSQSSSPEQRRSNSKSSDDGSKKEECANLKYGNSSKKRRRYSTSDDNDDDGLPRAFGKKRNGKNKSKKNKKLKPTLGSVISVKGKSKGDHGGDDFLPLATGRQQKGKKKNMKFSLDHQTNAEQEAMKRKRAMRFGKNAQRKPVPSVFSRIDKRRNLRSNDDGDDDFFVSRTPDRDTFDPAVNVIVGTCRDIEKQYLRLNTAPDASQVRPQNVLEQSLALVKRKWKDTADYFYACDQLKSIRQDMTIQCIRNMFSVDVYETHARIALEKCDKEEFNQCQNQLKMLYKELPGCPNQYEFTAYRLLFFVFTENNLDIITTLAALNEDAKTHECISFALLVRLSWALQDYHRLFKMYKKGPPRMCVYLMDLFVERERKKALKILLKSYRPFLPVDFLTNELGFDSDVDCVEALKALQIPLVEDDTKIDCRQCSNVAL